MKKVFSIVLSFMLLVGHMSLIVGTHYCGGETVESKIILSETHLGCGMSDGLLSCSATGETNTHNVIIENIPCCENEYQTIQVTDEFVKDTASFTFSVDFALAYVYASANFELLSNSAPQSFTDFSPPPLEKDFQVLFQTFLI